MQHYIVMQHITQPNAVLECDTLQMQTATCFPTLTTCRRPTYAINNEYCQNQCTCTSSLLCKMVRINGPDKLYPLEQEKLGSSQCHVPFARPPVSTNLVVRVYSIVQVVKAPRYLSTRYDATDVCSRFTTTAI